MRVGPLGAAGCAAATGWAVWAAGGADSCGAQAQVDARVRLASRSVRSLAVVTKEVLMSVALCRGCADVIESRLWAYS